MITRHATSRLVRATLATFLALAAGACARGTTGVATVQPRAFDFASIADSILVTPPLHRGHIGIEVYDPGTGRILYQHDGERRFVPASNQKLWGTATALHELGPEYRYRTPILGIGLDAVTGTAEALVVVGRGDPTLSARFHPDDLAALDSLADSVSMAGVRRITGDLIVDASFFDPAIIPGTWTFGNLNGTSAPPTGAFVVAEGVFRVRVAPGPSVGAPAVVEPRAPAGVVPVLNQVITTQNDSTARTSNSRGPWSDTLRISGSVNLEAEERIMRMPMTDPVRFAAEALAEALRARGIVMEGGVRIVHDSTEAAMIREGRISDGPAILSVREVAAWTSPPMGDIAAAILAPSQNWIAEQVLRTLGAERRGRGSWQAGIAVTNEFLFGTVGIDSTALRLNDGSGMSNQNLVTPHAVIQLYDYARTAPWGPVFRAALAKPAEPGTLSSRLRHLEGRMAGKTGTLNGVNALSGYLRVRDGRELIFSIVSNASGLPSGPVVAAIDQLVGALADGNVPR